MSLETEIARLATAIEENTRTMRELAGQTTVPVKPTKSKAEKPAPEPEKPAPAVVAEPEPVVEEPIKEPVNVDPEPETPYPAETTDADPGDPEPTTTGDDDYDSWDEPKLRLAIQEFCKTKLISADSAAFKAKFGPELAKHGVEKAAKLPSDKLAEFYRAALTW